ncbi:hypothetical protein E2C01_046136 [Portunus trituberculatus]|uniref:Uncharacterized protein n=1 Tax=Portunus trituberculatus TaxID=210409 RepID=A0A5B7G055_PORTR|nr:hypothetical protein [Portunus trituberculatus]
MPKEEQQLLQHHHWRKTSWQVVVCLHSLPTRTPTSRYVAQLIFQTTYNFSHKLACVNLP